MKLPGGAELPFKGSLKKDHGGQQPPEDKDGSAPHNRIAELFRKKETDGGVSVTSKTTFNLGDPRDFDLPHYRQTEDHKKIDGVVDLENDKDDDKYDGPIVFSLKDGRKFYSRKSVGTIEAYELETPLDLMEIKAIYIGTK